MFDEVGVGMVIMVIACSVGVVRMVIMVIACAVGVRGGWLLWLLHVLWVW